MTPKIYTGIIIMLILMVPSIMLIEGALRDTKEENEDIVKLKMNRTESIFNFLFMSGILALGIFFLILPFLISQYWLIFLYPLGFLYIVDFMFNLNHLVIELNRKIYWHKKANFIELKEPTGSYRINKADILKAIAWVPRFAGGYRSYVPGEKLKKYQLITKDHKIDLSDKLLSNYPELIESLCHGVEERKKQFNRIKNTMPNNDLS